MTLRHVCRSRVDALSQDGATQPRNLGGHIHIRIVLRWIGLYINMWLVSTGFPARTPKPPPQEFRATGRRLYTRRSDRFATLSHRRARGHA
jgi:hypothetical protein